MRRSVSPLVRAPLALLVFALAVAGCARGEKSAEVPASAALDALAPQRAVSAVTNAPAALEQETGSGASQAGLPVATALAKRMLVRNVSLSLVVADVDSCGARIERLVAARGGFVASSSLEDRGGFPWRQLTLRVPADGLAATLAELRAMAVKVTAETQSVEDVTDQAVDLQARLRTLRATEEELIGLLKDARAHGQKAEDVMAVYRELTGIRTQIEQYDAQLESLKGLAAMSTIAVQLQPDAAAGPIQPHGWRPGETVRSSVRQLAGALRGLGDFAIWAVIVGAPIALLFGLAAGLVAKLARRLRARRAPRA
ncbi:MAG: DUF4349 domain-containing protein [Candidatus Eisenbacteria bacterium]